MAVRLPLVDRGRAEAAKDVLGNRHRLKMLRVHAGLLSAQVIEALGVDRPDEGEIRSAVRRPAFSLSGPVPSVPVALGGASPDPASIGSELDALPKRWRKSRVERQDVTLDERHGSLLQAD
jgi:hypothetical protein